MSRLVVVGHFCVPPCPSQMDRRLPVSLTGPRVSTCSDNYDSENQSSFVELKRGTQFTHVFPRGVERSHCVPPSVPLGGGSVTVYPDSEY